MDASAVVVHVSLPKDVVEQLDAVRAVELRSRANQVRVLVAAGLRERNADAPKDDG